jgi:hypothetical protein
MLKNNILETLHQIDGWLGALAAGRPETEIKAIQATG